MKLRVIQTAVLSLLIAMAISESRVLADPSAPSEYQVKAAFLYNFVKFVEWPAKTFPAADSPIVIGIIGASPFGDNLEQTVRNKTVNGRHLLVKPVINVKDSVLKNCQVLFVCQSERKHVEEILGAVKDSNVLTVSDLDEFNRAGGMINFVMEDNRVRFEINDPAAVRAGLKISSKLLSLSKRGDQAK